MKKTREETSRLYLASRPRRKRSRRNALERPSAARFEDLEADTSWNWIRVALEQCSTCYFATSDQRDSRLTHTRESCSIERSRTGTLYRYTVIKERSLTISTRGIVSYPLIARDNLACILQCYMYPAHIFCNVLPRTIPFRNTTPRVRDYYGFIRGRIRYPHLLAALR